MKKLPTIVFTLAIMASAPAIAATIKTVNLTIIGKVSEVCTLTARSTPEGTSLDLTTQQSGVRVGDISAQCNIGSNGYSLSVDTRNASKLTSVDGRTTVGYTINMVKTQGNAINSGGYFSADSNSLDVPLIRDTTQQKADIFLNTTGSTAYAGTYKDTLTFTLTTL
jgi:hypothetical protein